MKPEQTMRKYFLLTLAVAAFPMIGTLRAADFQSLEKKGASAQPIAVINLAADASEMKNLWAEKPEIVKRRSEQLAKVKKDGRSHP